MHNPGRRRECPSRAWLGSTGATQSFLAPTHGALRGLHRSYGSIGLAQRCMSSVVKLSPQPHSAAALGFLKVNVSLKPCLP